MKMQIQQGFAHQLLRPVSDKTFANATPRRTVVICHRLASGCMHILARSTEFGLSGDQTSFEEVDFVQFHMSLGAQVGDNHLSRKRRGNARLGRPLARNRIGIQRHARHRMHCAISVGSIASSRDVAEVVRKTKSPLARLRRSREWAETACRYDAAV